MYDTKTLHCRMNCLNIEYDNQIRNVKELLSEALYSGYMADVTLVSDDLIHITAHKFILAACSPVFRNILVEDSSQMSQILYLKGISSNFIRMMLTFVYKGQVNIDSIEAPIFLKNLQEFQIYPPTRSEKDYQALPYRQHLVDVKCVEIQNPPDNDESINSLKMTNECDDISQELELTKVELKLNECKELNIDKQIRFTTEKTDQRHGELDSSSKVSVNVGKTKCPECGKLVQNINQHMKWKHNDNSKKHHCTECSYVSLSPSNVKLHFMNIHEADIQKRRAHQCDKCEKVYTLASSLNDHIRKFHENQKQTCHICQKQFTNGLNNHIKTVHEGKRFPCEYCGHQATQRSSLKMHIEAKHKGIKHTCDQCGKSFSQLGTLNVHIKTQHNK